MNITNSYLRSDSSKNSFFPPGISSMFISMHLILVFLFLRHVCFVKQSLDVYAVQEDSTKWDEIRSFCLTSEKLASNYRYGENVLR